MYPPVWGMFDVAHRFKAGDVESRVNSPRSRSWMAVLEIIWDVGNGPMNRGESLRESVVRGMSRADSHTSCPARYRGALDCLRSATSLVCWLERTSALRARHHVRLHVLKKAWTEGTPASCSRSGNNGVWYPIAHWNGERLVDETGSELWAYLAHASCRLHEEGWQLLTNSSWHSNYSIQS